MPQAFSNGGATDGALFIVELHPLDGVTQTLSSAPFHRLVVPADRAPRSFEVQLPAHRAGDQLILRTDPGPAGNRSWDWTYLTNLSID